MYAPPIVHVGLYFDKKRGIATGIASSGSGIGVFILPPICEAIFNQYGFTGMFLILGGLMLHGCVAALLYRPIKLNAMQDTQGKASSDGPPDVTDDSNTGLQKYLNYKLLKNINFLTYAISIGMCIAALGSSQMLLADQAIMCGISETNASLLLGVTGIADAIARASSGFLFDWRRLRPIRYHIFNFAILLSAVTIYAWLHVCQFEVLVVLCFAYGLMYGFITAQRILILADIMGIETLSSAFGVSLFFQGAGTMIYPLFAGYLRDVTGSYVASFIFLGSSQIISFILLYVGYFYSKRK